MRLTVADIKRINREVEETEIRTLQRLFGKVEYDSTAHFGDGDYFKYGDWGDRD